MKKQQATTKFSGKTMKRWYVVFENGTVSVTWAETKDKAMEKARMKTETRCLSVNEVLPAPSAVEEVRPLKKNMHLNAAE